MYLLELYKCANPKACTLRVGGATSPSRTHPLVLTSEHFISTPPLLSGYLDPYQALPLLQFFSSAIYAGKLSKGEG